MARLAHIKRKARQQKLSIIRFVEISLVVILVILSVVLFLILK